MMENKEYFCLAKPETLGKPEKEELERKRKKRQEENAKRQKTEKLHNTASFNESFLGAMQRFKFGSLKDHEKEKSLLWPVETRDDPPRLCGLSIRTTTTPEEFSEFLRKEELRKVDKIGDVFRRPSSQNKRKRCSTADLFFEDDEADEKGPDARKGTTDQKEEQKQTNGGDDLDVIFGDILLSSEGGADLDNYCFREKIPEEPQVEIEVEPEPVYRYFLGGVDRRTGLVKLKPASAEAKGTLGLAKGGPARKGPAREGKFRNSNVYRAFITQLGVYGLKSALSTPERSVYVFKDNQSFDWLEDDDHLALFMLENLNQKKKKN